MELTVIAKNLTFNRQRNQLLLAVKWFQVLSAAHPGLEALKESF